MNVLRPGYGFIFAELALYAISAGAIYGYGIIFSANGLLHQLSQALPYPLNQGDLGGYLVLAIPVWFLVRVLIVAHARRIRH